MKIVVCTIVIIFATIIATVIIMLSNPLRKSPEEIRTDILELTPIGMSMEDVIDVIRNNSSWRIERRFDQGYIEGRWYVRGPHQGAYSSLHDVAIVGVNSMEVYIGSYRYFFFLLVFETRVSAFFGFDEDSNLVDVGIRKYDMRQ